MITIKFAQYDCGSWYEVKVNGVVVACCGTLSHARQVADQQRKNILEKLIQGS